jgi:SAM-dependent methyltransferase
VQYRVIDGFRLLRCSRCSLVYLDDKVDPAKFINDAKESYQCENKQIEYWSFPEMYNKYSFVFDKFFHERLSRCLKYNKHIKAMFDIGAGYGFWMAYCYKRGIEVKGIEISEEAVKYGRDNLGLNIEKSSLIDFPFDKQYDLYNLCDVLEHLENPNKNLQVIYNVIKPKSLLYIQVPDVLGVRIPLKHNLGLPHHLWQFNFKTLKMLLEKNGFKILKRWHGVQGVIGCYERNEVNLFQRFKWQFAKIFNIGNRLTVLCRR